MVGILGENFSEALWARMQLVPPVKAGNDLPSLPLEVPKKKAASYILGLSEPILLSQNYGAGQNRPHKQAFG